MAGMGSMRSVEVVEILSGSKFLIQIDIVGIRQQLIELLLICTLGTVKLSRFQRQWMDGIHL